MPGPTGRNFLRYGSQACGLVMGMLLALLILRPAGPGTMLLILIAIMLWGVSGLYFGERTFFAMRAERRAKQLTVQLRSRLRIAQRSFLWEYLLSFVLYLGMFLFSVRGSIVLLFFGFSCQMLSFTIADFAGRTGVQAA